MERVSNSRTAAVTRGIFFVVIRDHFITLCLILFNTGSAKVFPGVVFGAVSVIDSTPINHGDRLLYKVSSCNHSPTGSDRGPERARPGVTQPGKRLQYRLQVRAADTHGGGSAFATVRIYNAGERVPKALAGKIPIPRVYMEMRARLVKCVLQFIYLPRRAPRPAVVSSVTERPWRAGCVAALPRRRWCR